MTENPYESLNTAIACHSRDWSTHHRDAWIYGIVCGWDEALDEVAAKHGWNEEAKNRLKRLHKQFNYERNTYNER